MGDRQDMEHGVGGAAHRDIQRHGIVKRAAAGDRARQHRGVAVAVVGKGHLDDPRGRLFEQLAAIGMGRHHRAVARQRQAQRLVEAVHRVGREHSRARTAGRTGIHLDAGQQFVGHRAVAAHHHRVHQIVFLVTDHPGFHRSARNKNRRDIEAHRRHQHPGGDFVAVADADHGIRLVGVDHVFHAVGDDFARRQRIEHPVVAHGDPVIDGDGVEFRGKTALRFDQAFDKLAHVVEVDVARHERAERVDDGNDRLAELAVLHAVGAPEAARAGHQAALRGGVAA